MFRVSIIAAVRSLVLVGVAFLAAVFTAFGGSAPPVALTANALIVPGTGSPDPAGITDFMENAIDYYIAPTTESCAVECTPVAVPYIAQWWPFPMKGWGGLTGAKLDVSVASGVAQLTSDLVGAYHPSSDSQAVVFGFSQGTKVSSVVKSNLSKLSAADQANISFTLLANLTRPNGGLLSRFPFVGTVPIWDVTFGQPTLTNTEMATTDIAFQYDGFADFPQYPNLLSVLNALAGAVYVHPTLLSPNGRYPEGLPAGMTPQELAAEIADPANRQVYGDTTYITVPAAHLPLLQPIRDLGAKTHTEFITTPLTDLVEPALRVIIETGYNRSLSYGRPAPIGLIPPVNPLAVTVDFVNAIGQGVRAAVNDISGKAPASLLASARAVPAVAKPASAPLKPTRATSAAAVRKGAISAPATPRQASARAARKAA